VAPSPEEVAASGPPGPSKVSEPHATRRCTKKNAVAAGHTSRGRDGLIGGRRRLGRNVARVGSEFGPDGAPADVPKACVAMRGRVEWFRGVGVNVGRISPLPRKGTNTVMPLSAGTRPVPEAAQPLVQWLRGLKAGS
jgi:hypothetical protein